jgi:hypothetical protein
MSTEEQRERIARLACDGGRRTTPAHRTISAGRYADGTANCAAGGHATKRRKRALDDLDQETGEHIERETQDNIGTAVRVAGGWLLPARVMQTAIDLNSFDLGQGRDACFAFA